MFPNIRGFLHCLVPRSVLSLIMESTLKMFIVVSNVSNSTNNHALILSGTRVFPIW